MPPRLRDSEETRISLSGLLRQSGEVYRYTGKPDQAIARMREAVAVKIGRAHVELQSLMRISYAVFCLKKKKNHRTIKDTYIIKETTTQTNNIEVHIEPAK